MGQVLRFIAAVVITLLMALFGFVVIDELVRSGALAFPPLPLFVELLEIAVALAIPVTVISVFAYAVLCRRAKGFWRYFASGCLSSIAVISIGFLLDVYGRGLDQVGPGARYIYTYISLAGAPVLGLIGAVIFFGLGVGQTDPRSGNVDQKV
ncbi:hypothetical protein [Jannaschia donghaensis]|uniref:hypothetical protein n=1 Tax=Jannaschia donghaensis TaxID=420998 RepID=UPI0006D84874|nr:hypothetical protein [Jannaschia donghaensis]